MHIIDFMDRILSLSFPLFGPKERRYKMKQIKKEVKPKSEEKQS
jgi:hypothetical protein